MASIFVNVPGTGEYKIHPYIGGAVAGDDGKSLSNSFIRTSPDTACNGRCLTNETENIILTNQQWEIVPKDIITNAQTGVVTIKNYKIHNAYTKSYLTYSSAISPVNSVVLPKYDDSNINNNFQKWVLTPILNFSKMSNINTTLDNSSNQEVNKIIIYPNPTNDYLNIDNLKGDSNSTIEIIDLKGSKILSKLLDADNSKIYVGDINQGVYVVKIEQNGQVICTSKFIKK